LARNRLWVTLGSILVAGLALGLILAGGRARRRPQRAGRRADTDPLTQPVPGQSGRRTLRMPWKRPTKPAEAYLVRLKEDGQAVTAPPIPVSGPEIIFGSDPLQATRILDDPSVSPLHARLEMADGEYILHDEKSAAGTWVNHEALAAPCHLQHGDLLQIGRITYRFMLRKPPERPAPRITPTTR
jgi:hypothetical protein